MEKTRELSVSETAALLCYLAVCEVAAFHLHGAWLRSTDLVESARIWLARNGLASDWLERVAAATKAKAIARQVVEQYSIAAGSIDTSQLFIDSLTTNYADRTVGYVWLACWNEVAGQSQVAD